MSYVLELERRDNFRRVCYYLLHPKDGSKLPPDQVDPFICNYIIVGYAYIGRSDLVLPENIEDDIETQVD